MSQFYAIVEVTYNLCIVIVSILMDQCLHSSANTIIECWSVYTAVGYIKHYHIRQLWLSKKCVVANGTSCHGAHMSYLQPEVTYYSCDQYWGVPPDRILISHGFISYCWRWQLLVGFVVCYALRTNACIIIPSLFVPYAITCMHTHTYTHTYTYTIHMHIHTYIHTHTCIHIHTCTYTHIQTHMHTHVHTYIHACTHLHIHTHTSTHMYIHTHIHTHVHTHTHTCMHTHTHTKTNTHTHTIIHTHTDIHTHRQTDIHYRQ